MTADSVRIYGIICAMRRSEQIPYGVKDFKRIRLENFYYVDKTAFIRKMEALSLIHI